MSNPRCHLSGHVMKYSKVQHSGRERVMWTCPGCTWCFDPNLLPEYEAGSQPVRDLREHEEQKMIANYHERMQQKLLLEAME